MDLAVSAVMDRNVVAANTSMTLEELGSLFVEHRLSGVPVVDDGVLVGVVTASDLLRNLYPTHDVTTAAFADGASRCRKAHSIVNVALQKSVGDVMTRDVFTVRPQDYLRDAAALLYDNRIHRVFVVEGDKLVGVLAPFDLVRLYARNRIVAGSSTPTLDF